MKGWLPLADPIGKSFGVLPSRVGNLVLVDFLVLVQVLVPILVQVLVVVVFQAIVASADDAAAAAAVLLLDISAKPGCAGFLQEAVSADVNVLVVVLVLVFVVLEPAPGLGPFFRRLKAEVLASTAAACRLTCCSEVIVQDELGHGRQPVLLLLLLMLL